MSMTLVLSGLLTWMIHNELLAMSNIGYGSFIILFLSGLCGALAAGAKIKRMKLQVHLLSGGIYYLMLLCIHALFFGGEYHGMGVTAIIVFLSGAAATAITMGQGRKRVRKGRNKHIR